MIIGLGIVIIIVILVLLDSIRILREYERGHVFRLGIYSRSYGPGFSFTLPVIENMVKIDLRIITVDLPTQEVLTQDNIPVHIDAIYYFQFNPDRMYYHSEYEYAVSEIVQGMLRSIIGQRDLDEILTHAKQIDDLLYRSINEHGHIKSWAIKINYVGIKSIKLPEFMQRAMAKQAEAERRKRAKTILASSELEASKQLAQAGAITGSRPETIHLRYLQVLTQLAHEKSRIILFPIPVRLLATLAKSKSRSKDNLVDW